MTPTTTTCSTRHREKRVHTNKERDVLTKTFPLGEICKCGICWGCEHPQKPLPHKFPGGVRRSRYILMVCPPPRPLSMAFSSLPFYTSFLVHHCTASGLELPATVAPLVLSCRPLISSFLLFHSLPFSPSTQHFYEVRIPLDAHSHTHTHISTHPHTVFALVMVSCFLCIGGGCMGAVCCKLIALHPLLLHNCGEFRFEIWKQP
uniref:Uncharacterized protein n=1 Tax=Physcomitrium patens TaxID=3218 RepID=A0A2K1IS29_PHYPA|nr:hypothetical protein PHYPA_026216 [Physcomitrium patens]